MIEVSNLVKRYGGFEAVRGVSFVAGTGKVVGLLGPNGAGKTTIMKVLTGYHRPSSGQALLNDIDVAVDPVAVKSSVGYLAEGVPLYTDMTVREYLDFIAESRQLPAAERAEAIAKACQSCGLKGMDDVRIEHLSKGFRQRVGLAQAILHDPAILILDEPTTGLDPNQILEIRSLIRSLGVNKTVILSTHILQEVEALCSEVIIINEGRIVAQGTTAEIARSLQGEDRLDCLVKLPANAAKDAFSAAKVGAALRASGVIGSCEVEALSGGKLRLKLLTGAGQADDAAAAVFGWAKDQDCTLLDLRREALSLEQIFVQLTGEEAKR
ncbi:MAG: MFS transporter [Spirochaetes bacterium GWD1_61_31]|nr:MAG: MFS transporter [Spirochaetes bacterium GWB1_60_80]OHD35479.1 MAG: MFS transporter [Spirochaetes bacterium GWC1_61_12]OHD38274.1 MAG: MFS transporter [Spirochaetes bacterium GWD1_61_31]OHD42507.1 MAG: MFS transporter [Spirochaetes bacterium GWE1_60_18]OHD58235.1 MAG: MFS transporter [Spirochaetes bacterium GWF1_60_12]HAP44293.1 MFS transporter [Spirochaetaceae bacterium]